MCPGQHQKRRRWLFRLLCVWIAVSVTVAVAEVGLRKFRPSFTPDLFLKPHFVTTDGHFVETEKQRVAVGYAHAQRFSIDKPQGTIRIALVGGSTVQELGDAVPLRQALVDAGLARDVEILNFGLCGCGTDREVQATAQALDLGADVVVLYTGHNEFVSESNINTYRMPNWPWRHSEILQLCFGPAWMPEPGRFYSREEKEAVYARFRDHMQKAISLCRQKGVAVVVGVPPTNLVEPPMIYTSDTYDVRSLPPEPYRHYHSGMELLRQGRIKEGMEALERAIDDSPRPWRATRRIKQTLRELAAESSLPLADVDASLRARSPVGFPWPGFFVDHCHLNYLGQEVLLRSLFQAIAEALRPTPGS